MECPYCKYKTGWDSETLTTIDNEEGEFFELSNQVKMKREYTNDRTVYGCPRCKGVFIDV